MTVIYKLGPDTIIKISIRFNIFGPSLEFVAVAQSLQ